MWDHLRLDFEVLAKSLGRSVDDTVLCIHMVLAQMTAHVSRSKLPRILNIIELVVFEERRKRTREFANPNLSLFAFRTSPHNIIFSA